MVITVNSFLIKLDDFFKKQCLQTKTSPMRTSLIKITFQFVFQALELSLFVLESQQTNTLIGSVLLLRLVRSEKNKYLFFRWLFLTSVYANVFCEYYYWLCFWYRHFGNLLVSTDISVITPFPTKFRTFLTSYHKLN